MTTTDLERVRKDFPAKFSRPVLAEILRVLDAHGGIDSVLDPFAGVGGVHALRAHGYSTFGVEIEREWAAVSPHTFVGNALDPSAVKTIATHVPFDAIVTSPAYGNRMADKHTARDVSTRNTYTHRMRTSTGNPRRTLHRDNTGQMQWGDEYRAFHLRAWSASVRLLRHHSVFVLNVSDHKRNGQRQPVSGWHVGALQSLGLSVVDVCPIATQRNRNGANRDVRVDAELIVVMVKP